MARSLRASVEGLKRAEAAFKLKGWTQEYLAGATTCTRPVVINFFARRPVEKRFFLAICTELKLEWGEIAELEAGEKRTLDPGLDDLVKTVRGKTHTSIQKRCGTMRVLDMEQPIDLNSIYTTVNILEKVSRNQRRSLNELLAGCDLENFDRFLLGRVQQKQIPGLDAVRRHDKLLILGKPGAGKTTFLKWLAIQCNAGELHSDRIPIFVTLKEFAEKSGQPTLFGFIEQQLQECGVSEAEAATTLLQAGRSLVLLDGLDEVREQDHDRVLQEIYGTSDRFGASQFVMTCRIAAREYTFAQFTEVEVADFNKKQITDFAQKWFQNDLVKAKEFPQELQANDSLQELATNPLLLTLLCLVFSEQGRFPSNRAELYKEGLDVLLKKWDVKRNIRRDEVYKQLSLQRKEDLLSQIAFSRFERSEYFFKQQTIEAEIRHYIRNLPQSSTDPNALQVDSEAVLKSIEAQHGLLVERARGIYSFSHLTFQEYFTARHIRDSPNSELLDNLVNHITEKRWREVFLLTVGLLPNADDLLRLMQRQINTLLAADNKLQQFLTWVEQKSCSVTDSYKPSTVRAFYLAHALDLALDLASALDFALGRDHALTRNLDLALDLILARELARACNLDPDLARAREHARALDFALDRDLYRELQEPIQQLRQQLPKNPLENWDTFENWWRKQGQAWIAQLRTVLIQHRNIGHDWQFSEAQKALLKQYYDANRLLVACLDSECYVSREVREKIEATLLLPIAEIEARQPQSSQG